MNENNEKIEGGEVKIKLPVSKKFENFWYYYKWHTIIAVFAVFVLVVLTLQTCSRVHYDCYVLYAGPHEIKRSSEGGNLSEYENALTSLKRISEDHDGKDGINISFLDLFVVNSEEDDEILADNPGVEINSALVRENTETLRQKLLFGEYYLCFLSERIFTDFEEEYEGAMFTPLAGYLPEGVEAEFCGENGIYLRSLPFSSLPVICDLPEDTVVCLRRSSEVSETFGGSDDAENFLRGEDMLKKLLAYGK